MRVCWILLGLGLGMNAVAATQGDRFYAIPPTVAPGAPLQLHWNVSADANARCAPSGGDDTIWRELGDLPARDWEWFNAPRTPGRHRFTLHCDVNGQMIQTSAFVDVQTPRAAPFYGPTRSPWQEVPAMAAAGLRAASRPATGDGKLLFEVEGRLAGYTANDADRSALIYDPDGRELIPLHSSADRQPIPGSSVAGALDVTGRYPTVATNQSTLWWGHSQCKPSAANCLSGPLSEPLRGVYGLTSLSTQTVVETPFLYAYIYRPYVAFDSTSQGLTDDFLIAQRNLYFMTDRGALAGVPQLISKIGSNGIAFDGPSTRPVFTRQALHYVAALAFETTASNVLALQGVINVNRQSQICGMNLTNYAPQHDSLFCVSRNRLSGEFGSGASSNPRAVATIGNGVIIVFESEADNLVAGDRNGVRDVFAAARVYGGAIKGPVRLSVATDGTESNGPSYAPSIAEDGHTLVFESDASNLIGNDRNGLRDVFLRDLIDGRIDRVSTAFDGGDADGPSDAAEISSDGRVLFRSQASNLLAQPQPNTQAIYFRQRLRHGGASRPSFSDLPLAAPTSGSVCGGGYHGLVISDGPASIHQDYYGDLSVQASEPGTGGSWGVVASYARGRLIVNLPDSDSVRTATVTISAEGLVPASETEVSVRSYEPGVGLFYSGEFRHYLETTVLQPGEPLQVNATLRPTDLNLQVQLNGADRHVVQVQLENAMGPLQIPVEMGLSVRNGFDPHSKIGGLLGICLDQPVAVDAKLSSGSWRDELVTADLQLSIYDELGILRYRAPDWSR